MLTETRNEKLISIIVPSKSTIITIEIIALTFYVFVCFYVLLTHTRMDAFFFSDIITWIKEKQSRRTNKHIDTASAIISYNRLSSKDEKRGNMQVLFAEVVVLLDTVEHCRRHQFVSRVPKILIFARVPNAGNAEFLMALQMATISRALQVFHG